jgi:hypothetical protein
MEAKFGPSEKRIKKTDINRNEIFQKNSQVHNVLTTRGILVEVTVEPVEGK